MCFSILAGLGTWQVKRLHWKDTIIAQLDEAYSKDTNTPPDFDKDFSYGQVEGTFLAKKTILIGPRTRNGQVGKDVLVPIIMNDQTGLIVNLGWVPDGWDKQDLPIHHLDQKNIRFEGLTRKPDWNMFTSGNVPQQDLWFRPDINEIAKAKDLKNPLPVMLYAYTASYKMDATLPNHEKWYPRNKHLQYALFWYSMAAVLTAIYLLRFVRNTTEV